MAIGVGVGWEVRKALNFRSSTAVLQRKTAR